MTHPSKRKGSRFESEIVELAKGSGLEAKRAYASNGESLGLHAEVDVVAGVSVEPAAIHGEQGEKCWKIQCKRRKSLAKFMVPSEEVDAVAMRSDFGEPLVVLRLHDWLDLL